MCKSHITFTVTLCTEMAFLRITSDFWGASPVDNSQSSFYLDSAIHETDAHSPWVNKPPVSTEMMLRESLPVKNRQFTISQGCHALRIISASSRVRRSPRWVCHFIGWILAVCVDSEGFLHAMELECWSGPWVKPHNLFTLEARRPEAPCRAATWSRSHGDLVAEPGGSPAVTHGLG